MPAPVNTKIHLISGFLGAGKTTILKGLVAQKPANEKWALIVNEFGDVGIDAAILEEEGMPIAEIFSGCLCCAAGPQLTATVANLLRQEKPDRLLIEASGLAHAASVIDELKTPPLSNAVTIAAVITVVDVRQFTDSNYFRQPLYRDQVNIADVLVGTKGDLADAEAVDAFNRLAQQWFPPKKCIVEAPCGRVDIAWLETSLTERPHYRPHVTLPDAGNWQSAGWVFPSEHFFDAEHLTRFFDSLPQQVNGLIRAKGIFCVEGSWVCLNWSEGVWGASEVQWCRDNRFEMIAQTIDESAVEEKLMNCMENPSS